MPTLTIEYQTDAERLMIEQAVAYFTDLHALARTAPPGTVLDTCEAFALVGGRQLLRDSLAHVVQDRLDHADAQKKVPTIATRGDTPATC